jgi:hypothetical protein
VVGAFLAGHDQAPVRHPVQPRHPRRGCRYLAAWRAGRLQRRVDTGPVQAHLTRLVDSGLLLAHIADEAGVPRSTARRVWQGAARTSPAPEHWRYVNGAHLVVLVRAGARFEKGGLVERPKQAATEAAA